MIRFKLNRKNNLVEWLKEKKIPADFDKIKAVKEYMSFENNLQRDKQFIPDEKNWEETVLKKETLIDDLYSVKVLKIAIGTGKIKTYKMKLDRWEQPPKNIEKGYYYYSIYQWQRSYYSAERVLTLFEKYLVKPCFVLDRVNNAAYVVLTVDDLTAVNKKVMKELEATKAEYEKNDDEFCRIRKEIDELEVKSQKPWEAAQNAKNRISSLERHLSMFNI